MRAVGEFETVALVESPTSIISAYVPAAVHNMVASQMRVDTLGARRLHRKRPTRGVQSRAIWWPGNVRANSKPRENGPPSPADGSRLTGKDLELGQGQGAALSETASNTAIEILRRKLKTP